jgi:outer membrane protein TolC
MPKIIVKEVAMPKFEKAIIVFLTAFMLMCFIPAALAGETVNDEGLTIEQAIEKALSYSKTLQQADLDIEKAEVQRDSLADTVKFIPLEASGSAEADQAYTALVSADISWSMTKKTKDINEDKIALSAFSAYIDVLKAQENLQYYQEALSKAQTEWKVANIKYQQGLISSLEKSSADVQYLSAQKAVSSAEDQLTTAYQALNKLIGSRVDDRLILSQKPAYQQLVIDELEAAVNRAVDANPSIWLAGQNIDLAKLQLSLFDWTSGNSNSYRASEITIEKAELSAVEARSELRQAVRNIYYNILALEISYTMQEEAVKLAEDNLRVKTLMNSVGMATKLDIQTAELDLQKARYDLDAIVYQHEYLKLVFEKPWAAM